MKRWLHQGSLGRGSSNSSTQNIFYEKNVYLLIHDLFHDFEIMLDDTKANLELKKTRTHLLIYDYY